MITVSDDPNRFIGVTNNNGGNSLLLLASGTINTKDVKVPFMTWVPPKNIHLSHSQCLALCVAAVAGIIAVVNDGVLMHT